MTDTGEPVLLPFRMSCFAISNLVVTAGMLSPGLGVSVYISGLLRLLLTMCRRLEHYYGR